MKMAKFKELSDADRWQITLHYSAGLRLSEIHNKMPQFSKNAIAGVLSSLKPIVRFAASDLRWQNDQLRLRLKENSDEIQQLKKQVKNLTEKNKSLTWNNDPQTQELKKHAEYYREQSKELITKGFQIFMNQKTIRIVVPGTLQSELKSQLKSDLDRVMKKAGFIPIMEKYNGEFIKYEYEIEEK